MLARGIAWSCAVTCTIYLAASITDEKLTRLLELVLDSGDTAAERNRISDVEECLASFMVDWVGVMRIPMGYQFTFTKESVRRNILECTDKSRNILFQDREFVEMEVPYNGAPKRPGSPSPLTSPAHSTASRGGLLHSCCGRCYPQRYQVRGRRILASTTSISEGPPSSSSHSHQSQPSGQPVQSHYQSVDPTTVPNVAFNVPGDNDRLRRQGTSSSSPYNETRV